MCVTLARDDSDRLQLAKSFIIAVVAVACPIGMKAAYNVFLREINF